MGAPVMVDLEPCLDPGGLDCCGDSVALEVLAHHRCLSAQAGCGCSAVGLRQGTVGAQLAQKRALTFFDEADETPPRSRLPSTDLSG